MILVDYTQIAVAAIMQFQDDIKRGTKEKSEGLIRHVILNSILSNKKKFGSEYGQVVICTDNKKYWRKDVFPYYKAARSKNRENSDIDWAFIFDTISSVRQDLIDIFPYKVINVEGAEADDIIAVLTDYFTNNELVTVGLEEEPQKILILSSDGDNIQLQTRKNVRQWSPAQKKFVKPAVSAKKSLIDKICMGDTGDGVPNIMSPDDIFIQEGVRQKSFRKARLEEFYEKGIDACKNDSERRNYQRNELLVSYDKIPEGLRQQIIDTYKTTMPSSTKMKIMQYFVKHRMKQLMDTIEDF